MWAVMRLRSLRRTTTATSADADGRRKLRRRRRLTAITSNHSHPMIRHVCWHLRRVQMFFCYDDDEEEEDVEEMEDPMSTRPPALEELQKCTGFDKRWLMFLYRNFKQHCANGRMTEIQWRQLLRMLFPRSADDNFADRVFQVIARDKPHLVFKDLVMCLWELTESGRIAEIPGSSSAAAQFAFQLMQPDDKGRVDEIAFLEYVKSVFALRAKKNLTANALGLPSGSIYRSRSIEEIGPPSPMLRRWAFERFKMLDSNQDGCVTIDDVQRLINSTNVFLPTLADYERKYVTDS